MAQKIRDAMAGREARYQLTGLLEMDDAYFGGQKKVAGKRGRGAAGKSSVVVSVQVNARNKPGYAGMQVVPSVNHEQIGQVLDTKISTTATTKTDGFTAYSIIEKQHREHQRIALGDPQTRRSRITLGAYFDCQLQRDSPRPSSWRQRQAFAALSLGIFGDRRAQAAFDKLRQRLCGGG
jgi:transposase-like protein